jgi:hypothetical protein
LPGLEDQTAARFDDADHDQHGQRPGNGSPRRMRRASRSSNHASDYIEPRRITNRRRLARPRVAARLPHAEARVRIAPRSGSRPDTARGPPSRRRSTPSSRYDRASCAPGRSISHLAFARGSAHRPAVAGHDLATRCLWHVRRCLEARSCSAS